MLPVARYRYHFIALTPVQFPEWSGSVLRGAFGHALRRIACMTRQKDCTGCPLLATCPYPSIFAPPPVDNALQRLTQAPAPYVIEPADWGARRIEAGTAWHFDLVLFGRALKELPMITLAWRQAARRGLGPGDGQSELDSIERMLPTGAREKVLATPDGSLKDHRVLAPDCSALACQRLTLHFRTPLRLQDNGRAVPPARLTAVRLLMAAVRRASLIAECHASGPPNWDYPALVRLAKTILGTRNLKWQDWTRRSSRQQQSMQLGGAIGTWQLEGELTPFMPALRIGEWLHIGKETVFGLGRYDLVDSSANLASDGDPSLEPIDFTKQSDTPQ